MWKDNWYSVEHLGDICLAHQVAEIEEKIFSYTVNMAKLSSGAWKIWSLTSHRLRRDLLTDSFRSSWSGWKSPKSSLLISVLRRTDSKTPDGMISFFVWLHSPDTTTLCDVLQRRWWAVDEWKNRLMSRKSNSLPRWDVCVKLLWAPFGSCLQNFASFWLLFLDFNASHQPVFQKPLPLLLINACKSFREWWAFIQ